MKKIDRKLFQRICAGIIERGCSQVRDWAAVLPFCECLLRKETTLTNLGLTLIENANAGHHIHTGVHCCASNEINLIFNRAAVPAEPFTKASKWNAKCFAVIDKVSISYSLPEVDYKLDSTVQNVSKPQAMSNKTSRIKVNYDITEL